MNINTLSNIYSQTQAASVKTSKISSPQPVRESNATVAQPVSSGQSTISGQGLMMSRLFGKVSTLPEIQTQLTKSTQDMDATNFLTKSDLSALSDLYGQAQAQGTDLRYVDDIARDLGNYRKFGSVSGSYNTGNTYDASGRVQTVSFTDKDAATASRILSSDNLSGSGLDPAFLRYELDPGYSFSHTASFDYLESIMNTTGSDVTSKGQHMSSQFATYVSQGQNNYIINTASEATLKIEEPDVINKDGVFTVTETGKKHGFRLEGNDVVQDKGTGINDTQSGKKGGKTLMDYFLNQNNTDGINTKNSASFFDFLFSSKANTKSHG
ncbi:hypothetical protein [Pantoea agglomerans]|uniref:hypothetical protein n=1 Tax=Enterobacter agglomerans TaxID=549 RepID=UPI000F02FA38|nr:hypothetical protein [Pantoea agglomerans]AYP25369.1 hypothetical protein D0A61_20800 [Pantoea agglomerans]